MTPASGPEIIVNYFDTPVLSLRLPDEVKWEIRGGGDAATSYLVSGYVDINGRSTPLVPGKGRAFYAQVANDTISPLGPQLERVEDRTVAGVDGFVLEGTDSSGFTYVFGGIYGDAQVDVIFDLPRSNPQARRWIESILASAELL